MSDLRAIILAAGKGTRMKSNLSKVLHPVCGKPILFHVLNALQSFGSLKINVVVGHQSEQIRTALKDFKNITCVDQKELRGTADAVSVNSSSFSSHKGHVLVLCGDTPLLNKADLKALYKNHKKSNAVATVLTAVVHDPSGYGRIIRDQQSEVVAIREDKDAEGFERSIAEINVGVYCFQSKDLFRVLKKVKLNPQKKEFYLTDVIEILSQEGKKISSYESADAMDGLGINSRRDLAQAQQIMGKRIIFSFMDNGVTVEDPDSTFIAADVKIGQDTVIRPCTYIEQDVNIGERCVIGPFARLRPKTRIMNDVELGNFTEVSRSTIGSNTFMKHFGFIGDSRIGNGVNIGAGCVTANFDGQNKHTTKISDNAFIGSDSIMIAPIQIGKGAIVGAGSVLTKGTRVPPSAKAVGVPARILKGE